MKCSLHVTVEFEAETNGVSAPELERLARGWVRDAIHHTLRRGEDGPRTGIKPASIHIEFTGNRR
jgi:hypothetical protein